MNRQQENQSRTQAKKSGIEVSSILQRRGALRSASEPSKQWEQETENHTWQESPLVKNFKPIPLRSLQKKDEILQRQEEEEETTQILQAQEEEEEEEEEVQAKEAPGKTPTVTPNLEARIQSVRGGGQALAPSVRNFFEPLFGADFSDVRVHRDSQAASMSKELNAQAFTIGNDIFFNTGRYELHTKAGKHLLAHELTHTIQQQPGRKLSSTAKVMKHNPSNLLQRRQMEGITSRLPAEPRPAEGMPELGFQDKIPEAQSAIAAPPPKKEAAPPSPSEAPSSVSAQPQTAPTTEKTASAPVAPATTEPTEAAAETAIPEGEAVLEEEATEETAEAKEAKKAPGEEKETETAVEKAPTSPKEDPAFQAVVKKAKRVAAGQRSHAPAKAKAKEAQDAAEEPANAIESKAQANQVGEMEKAETPAFDAVAFKEALKKRIEETTPKNLEEADNFKKNNKLNAVKGEMTSKVKDEKAASQKPLEEKTKQAPDKSGIEAKSVTKLPPPKPGKAPPKIGAGQAAPKPKIPGEIEAPLQQESQTLDQQMAEANVTEEQLAKSNEPAFQAALDSKKEAQTNAVEGPKAYRQDEEKQLTRARSQSAISSQKKLQGMYGDRVKLLDQVAGQQVQSKTEDEKARAKVASDLQQIYQTTKTKVERILSELDGKVERAFDAGAKKAKQLFEDYVDLRMRIYKAKRYSGPDGLLRWGWDKLTSLPDEVNIFYVKGRELYLKVMDRVLDEVVGIVARELTQAKLEIANGKKEIQDYVAKLPQDLQKIGQEAAGEIQSQFDDLENTVNSKQDSLIDTLAQKYQENLKAVDERIKKMKEDNKGLIAKAVGAIKGVIETIRKIKAMFAKVFARIAEVVGLILQDPIGFFKNLIKGLKDGFNNFVSNIGKHLQAGLIAWLTGTLGPVGIQIPDDLFSLKGIFSLVMQILGLTWDYIRAKAVKLFGETVVAAMEKGVEIFQVIQREGAAGLWKYVKEQFSNLKEMVMDQIKEMVTTEIIKAGVKWVLSLLNPVAAFIKAAMAIYNIVMFFVERAAQIADFLNSIIDAVAAIAQGAVSGAAKLVETALAKSIPLIIGLLAALLGISGIAKKVQKIIQRIRKRIDKAIDKLLMKVKKLFKGAKKVGKRVVRALVKWWKAKKQFKGRDGKNHKLFLKGSQTATTLMLASQPQTVFDFIKRLKIEKGNSEALNAKISGKAKAQEIDKESKRKLVGATDKEKEADSKKKKDKIEKLMAELAPFVAILLGIKPEELPKSVVVYKTTTRDGELFALRTEAKILSREGEPGSPPKETNPVYDALFLRKLGGASYYVRGHMLNDNIHGPGVLKNLTPLSKQGNKNHLEEAEKSIKIAVKSGAVVRYTIAAKYAYSVSVPSDEELQKAGIDKAEWDNIKKVRKAENNVPKGLNLGADLLKRNPKGKWVKDKALVAGKFIDNPVNTNLNSYQTVKGPVQNAVGLKSSTVAELVDKTGLDKDLLTVIQNAAKLIPGSIRNINQIKNQLKNASGYEEEDHALYEEAISDISTKMSRKEVKLN